jgi:WD40 repeat protein
MWNADTGAPLGDPLTNHTGPVNSVAFSPIGQRLATASDDGTVRLWDAETRRPIGDPLGNHTGPVLSVAFSPDGERLASVGADKTAWIWPAIASATPDMLCDKLTASMSHTQWSQWISPDPAIGYRKLCPGLPEPPD